jgi:hypothetical protein
MKKRKEIRTSGLRKVFSRLDINFQKPEGPPHQTGMSFFFKIMSSRKLRLGKCPQNTKEKMDWCFKYRSLGSGQVWNIRNE